VLAKVSAAAASQAKVVVSNTHARSTAQLRRVSEHCGEQRCDNRSPYELLLQQKLARFLSSLTSGGFSLSNLNALSKQLAHCSASLRAALQ